MDLLANTVGVLIACAVFLLTGLRLKFLPIK
jgi:hypothetical protein